MTRRRGIALAGLAALAFAGAVWLWGARARDPGALSRVSTTLVSDSAPWLVEAVTLESTRGLVLECLARRPLADSTRRLPAGLLAGGERTGKRAALLVGTSFTGVALACDYPWVNPGRYGALRLAMRLPRLRSELVSTPLAHRVAADYLLGRGDVDSTNLVGIGISLGVSTVAAWAADDQRVRAVALLYGGARLPVMLEAAAARNRWPALVRKPLAPLVAAALGPLEPTRTVPRIAPRPLFIAIAPDDERIPRAASEALADAGRPGAQVLRLSGSHVTPRADSLLAMLTDSTAAWLARTGRPVR